MHKNIVILIISLTTTLSFAQVSQDSELFKTIVANDSIVFEQGFNQCNFPPMIELLSDDLEFYHDQAGIQNKELFIKAMEKNICGNSIQKPIRKLVDGSTKIFPLYNGSELYGAIQEGKHEFYIKEPNKELYITGEALFTILWVKDHEQWKAKRVLSYDHRAR